MLYDKYFSRYDFLKIYLWKTQIEFFLIYYGLIKLHTKNEGREIKSKYQKLTPQF